MTVLGHSKNDQKVQIVHKYSLPAPHMITVSLGFFTAFFRTTCAFRLYALQQRNLKNQDEVSKFHFVEIHFGSPLKPWAVHTLFPSVFFELIHCFYFDVSILKRSFACPIGMTAI